MPTPQGWTTTAELSVGEQVFDRTGAVCRVSTLTRAPAGMGLWRLGLSDGQEIVVTRDTRLAVSTPASRSADRAGQDGQQAAALRAGVDALNAAAARSDHGRIVSPDDLAGILDGTGLPWHTPGQIASALAGVGYPDGHTGGYRVREALEHLAVAARMMLAGPRTGGPTLTVASVAQMSAAGFAVPGRGARFALPLAGPLDLPAMAAPLDPYVLGVWLGAGHGPGAIAGHDEETVRQVERAGFAVASTRAVPGADDETWSITTFAGLARALSMVLATAPGSRRRLARRIPAGYLRASPTQRLALLQGLMDATGAVNRTGRCEVSLPGADLADDVVELARSLGIRVSMSRSGAGFRSPTQGWTTTTDRWRIHFTTDAAVFRLPRKAARLPGGTPERARWNYVVAAEEISAGEDGWGPLTYVGVDSPDRTWLTGGFVPVVSA